MISIVIPTYNERGNITGLVDGIKKAFGRRSYEILFVDDQSLDGTAEAVAKLAKKNSFIRLILHQPPRDLGRSILMGVQAARGDVIVGMDGDGNHDPRYIPHLIETLRRADLVVGSRFNPTNPTNIQIRQMRHWGSFLFNAMLTYCFRFPIRDNTSGFYAIRRKTLLSLDPRSIYYGYGEYHLRLVYRAKQHGLRIVEVPIVYGKRAHGQSKSHLFIMLVTYFTTAMQLKLGRKKYYQ